MPRLRTAFTLIELLLVIAIVAALVGILLPAIGKVRTTARMVQSLSNLRQLGTATQIYRAEHAEQLPIIDNTPGSVPAFASWFFGGKHCHESWSTISFGLYDVPAAWRPLNAYVMPDRVFSTRPKIGREFLPPEIREAEQAEPFRSPGDRFSYQAAPRDFPKLNYERSSYDDVGTSYHMNLRWFKQVSDELNARWKANPQSYPSGGMPAVSNAIVREAQRMFRLADSYNPSKFVFLYDQTADIAANDSKARDWPGEFGENNKSVVSFLDGHAAYTSISPGQAQTPDYQFFFAFGPWVTSIDQNP